MKRFIVLALLLIPVGLWAADAQVINQGNGPAHTSSMKVINAATSAGLSSSYNLQFMPKNHTWATSMTGGPTALSATLQGSIDDIDWYILDTSTDVAGVIYDSAGADSGKVGEMRHVVNKPVKFLRVDVATFTNGTTISVKTASGGN